MREKFVLVVDDEPDIRQLLQDILEDEGHNVLAAADAAEARAAVAEQTPDLVLLDIWMPDEDGISLLKSWKAGGLLVFPVIMISGHGTIETAVEATRFGAVDFIEKPVSLAKLLLTVEKAFQTRADDPDSEATPIPELPFLTGDSQYIARLAEQLDDLSRHNESVFFSGPAGSGREQFARQLHRRADDTPLGGQGSQYGAASVSSGAGLATSAASRPFIKLRCESLSSGSFHRELLGAEVNGVISRGFLDSANGGTLFLDNVDLLPEPAAGALLQSIVERRFKRDGGTTFQDFNARLLSSSRHSLADLRVGSGAVSDLMNRLSAHQVRFLALRERPEDLPVLLENLVQWHVETEGLNYRHFTVAAQNRLRNLAWPGNLPELKNLVQRSLILGGQAEIDVAEVESLLGISNATDKEEAIIPLGEELPLREARARFERLYLLKCLQNSRGNIGELAKHVGMERTHLYRKLRSLDIDLDKVRE